MEDKKRLQSRWVIGALFTVIGTGLFWLFGLRSDWIQNIFLYGIVTVVGLLFLSTLSMQMIVYVSALLGLGELWYWTRIPITFYIFIICFVLEVAFVVNQIIHNNIDSLKCDMGKDKFCHPKRRHYIAISLLIFAVGCCFFFGGTGEEWISTIKMCIPFLVFGILFLTDFSKIMLLRISLILCLGIVWHFTKIPVLFYAIILCLIIEVILDVFSILRRNKG